MSDKLLAKLNEETETKQQENMPELFPTQKNSKFKKSFSSGIENLYRHKKNIYDKIRHNNPFLN